MDPEKEMKYQKEGEYKIKTNSLHAQRGTEILTDEKKRDEKILAS